MNAAEPPSFETTDHERIYEYIEQHGVVAPDELPGLADLDPAGVERVLAALDRDGLVAERDGTLRLAIGDGAETSHRLDGSTVVVRVARQEELPAIVEAMQRVLATVFWPSLERLATRLDRDDALIRHNAAQTRVFFVPTIGDDIVGWVHVGASALQRVRGTAEITLGVQPEDRGRGIGSRLLGRGCEWAASNGYRKARHGLPATNDRGVAFLQSHGWEVETIRRNHYDDGDDRIDEVELAIDL